MHPDVPTTPRPMPPRPAWLRDAPQAWRPGTLDRAGLDAQARSLAARGDFAAGVRRFSVCWHEGYTSSAVLNSVMRNNARYVLLAACLRLDHVRDPALPDVSITPGRVLEFYQRIDRLQVVGGLSRVKAALGHVRAAGLLQPSPGRGDARLRPLEPAPALRQAMAGYLAGFLRGVDPVLPLPAPPAAMAALPDFVSELFSYRLAALLHDRYAINEGLPAMMWVTNREKGYPMLLALMRGYEPQDDGSAVAPGVPQQMADLAGISRGTARNLLQAAVAQGWIAPLPAHRWRLLPDFHAQVMQWMGREFVWMHALACAAWDATLARRAGARGVAAAAP